MQTNDLNQIIKNQFNKQAEKFSKWTVTQNQEYLQRYFTFCGMNSEDSLLDVACGSGEFSLFAAPHIRHAVGFDIADRMIDLARNSAFVNNITNVTFRCHDVLDIPAADNSFSIVVCKSALHHIHDYEKLIGEMIRCCDSGARISLQDIVAYENDRVNDFFEQMERNIDISHHTCLSKSFIQSLYERHNLTVISKFEVEVELNFMEYLGHAQQSEECRGEIQRLLKTGLADEEISEYFTVKDGDLAFKRNVFLILGRKVYKEDQGRSHQ